MVSIPEVPGDKTGKALVKAAAVVVHDVARPPAQELGRGLAAAMRLAFSPIYATEWTFDKAAEFAEKWVSAKLNERGVTPEQTKPVTAEVTGQAIHMLRLPSQDQAIRDLYLNLIAADATVGSGAHPAFVDIIRQLSPYEAHLVPEMRGASGWPAIRVTARSAQVHRTENIWYTTYGGTDLGDPVAIVNLVRLGLLEIEPKSELADHSAEYSALERHADVVAAAARLQAGFGESAVAFERGSISPTPLGERFALACTDPSPPAQR